jgi:hypothetical protein
MLKKEGKMKQPRLAVLLGTAGLLITTGAGSAGVVKLGAHGGLCIPNIRGSDTDIFSRGFTSRQGPFFGIGADIALTHNMSLLTEFNSTSQGGLRRGLQPITIDLPPELPVPPDTLLYADFRNETILDYLEVSFLDRLTFGRKLRFFVNLGPYAGYLVRARAVTSGTSALYLDKEATMPIIVPPATDPLVIDLGADTNVIDSLKRTNFGLAGGAGIAYPLGALDLTLEARFQLGLTTIQKDVASSGKSQTGAVVISLGILVPLARHQ